MIKLLGVHPTLVAVLVGASVAAGGAFAADPASPVEARQQHMKQQGGAVRAISDELKKDAPDKAAVAASAARLKVLAADLPSWFAGAAGAKSGSKPEVWTDAAGFAAEADKFKAEAGKLDALAQAGDLEGVKSQVRAVGGACKSCHDKFRAPEAH